MFLANTPTPGLGVYHLEQSLTAFVVGQMVLQKENSHAINHKYRGVCRRGTKFQACKKIALPYD